MILIIEKNVRIYSEECGMDALRQEGNHKWKTGRYNSVTYLDLLK